MSFLDNLCYFFIVINKRLGILSRCGISAHSTYYLNDMLITLHFSLGMLLEFLYIRFKKSIFYVLIPLRSEILMTIFTRILYVVLCLT